jgi:hypothetical protein
MKSLSRLAAMILAVVMTLAFAIPVAANATPFRDVPANHYAFNAINWVSHPDNGGIMVGDAAGNFHPDQILTKFEAARIFAMAAGYRPATQNVAPDLRAEINRSFDEFRPFLDSMATKYAQWSRIADREIAFLLYRKVLTQADVERFIDASGATPRVANLSRQEAIAWMVRLIGRQAHAQAIVIPHNNPFADDAAIDPMFIRYVYYARDAGIISAGGTGGGNFNPNQNFNRAQMAGLFFNVMGNTPAPPPPGSTTPVSTVTGIVEMMYRNEQIFISSPLGPQNFHIAQDATIIVDNVQRTAAFIRNGMTVNAVLNAQGHIISLVARTVAETPQPTPQPDTTPNSNLNSDEGFIVSTATLPASVTVRTQRVRITGQIVDEVRTFTLAPNAVITRGDATITLSDVQAQDIAFFRFDGTVIHELNLEERERTLQGVLLERRPADHLGMQTIIIELPDGDRFEIRVLPTTAISRGAMRNLQLQDLRIGDAVTALLENGQLTLLTAVGQRSVTEGRLTEIRITQYFSQINIQRADGSYHMFTIMPGIYDVYSLRIGMDVRIFLDSWEVLDAQVLSQANQQTIAVLGHIQAIRVGQALTVVEMDGQSPRSHTIVINNDTLNAATGQRLDFAQLRVNMNVYVVMVGPQSNVARSVLILP